MWQRGCTRALQAAKHAQDHEEYNQNDLKYFCANNTSPFRLGVKINISELMCFESLTSFHVSFILYQSKSPLRKPKMSSGL